MKRTLILAASLCLLAGGCYSDGDMIDIHTHIYYRYFNDHSPPIDEFYSGTKDGLLLKSFAYDSDGDWFPDTSISFSRDPSSLSYKKHKIPITSVDKFVTRPNLVNAKLNDFQLEQYSTEPDCQHPANAKRRNSEIYQQVKNYILETYPLPKKIDPDKLDLKRTEAGAILIPFLLDTDMQLRLRTKDPIPTFPANAKDPITYIISLLIEKGDKGQPKIQLKYNILCDNIKQAIKPKVEVKLLNEEGKVIKESNQLSTLDLTPPFRHRLFYQDEMTFSFGGVNADNVAKISIKIDNQVIERPSASTEANLNKLPEGKFFVTKIQKYNADTLIEAPIPLSNYYFELKGNQWTPWEKGKPDGSPAVIKAKTGKYYMVPNRGGREFLVDFINSDTLLIKVDDKLLGIEWFLIERKPASSEAKAKEQP